MHLISAVVCESVREEKNGSVTLVGAGDINLTHTEGTFPKSFGIWALFHAEDENEEITGIFIKGVCNRGTTHFKTPKLKLTRSKESTKAYSMALNMPYQPILHDGELEFSWSFDEDNWTPIIKIYSHLIKKEEAESN